MMLMVEQSRISEVGMEVLAVCKGVNGQVELLEDRVRITRRGFLAFGAHPWAGGKEILLYEITAIKFKRATWTASGFIQFMYPGGQETKGFHKTVADENAVMFWQRHQDKFIELRDAIDARRRQLRAADTSANDLAVFEKLAALHKSGVLTDDEFAAKKKQILGL
jgi:hypothetical protein